MYTTPHKTRSFLARIFDWSKPTGIVVQPTLGYHITNRQSRYITSARLKSAYTTQQVLANS